jgi:hypothetical protein
MQRPQRQRGRTMLTSTSGDRLCLGEGKAAGWGVGSGEFTSLGERARRDEPCSWIGGVTANSQVRGSEPQVGHSQEGAPD